MKSPFIAPFVLAVLTATAFSFPGVTAFSFAPQQPRDGFRAIIGTQAQDFRVPQDVSVVWQSRDLNRGTTQTRYQQTFAGAKVLGGQLTVWSDKAGTVVAVIGSHYPDLEAKNRVKLAPIDAYAAVTKLKGDKGRKRSELGIDPKTQRFFHKVRLERDRSDESIHIDAETGQRLVEYSEIQTHADSESHTGTGINGDAKVIRTPYIAAKQSHVMSNDKVKTVDALNYPDEIGSLMTDTDGVWDNTERNSPGQAAAVDAHYNVDVTDSFYRSSLLRRGVDNDNMSTAAVVHYREDPTESFNNAFARGPNIVAFGDGVGQELALSASLDIVAHEWMHNVTRHTSRLIYLGESGALNEAFSDIMGTEAERWANEHVPDLDPGVLDWHIGEASDATNDGRPGTRNLAAPHLNTNGNVSHYSSLFDTSAPFDFGHVHSNSGIANHAYYLTVEGGTNRGRSPGGNPYPGPEVAPISRDLAMRIFYNAFTSLPENATFDQMRQASIAAAATYGPAQRASVSDAWEAVGLYDKAPQTLLPTARGNQRLLPYEQPGQNYRLTFEGAVGQRVSLAASSGTDGRKRVTLYRPDGTVQAQVIMEEPSPTVDTRSFIEVQELAAAGTYTVVVDPLGPVVGSVLLTLYDAPADMAAPIALGQTVPVPLATPGQNGRLTLQGVAGQAVSVDVGRSSTHACARRGRGQCHPFAVPT